MCAESPKVRHISAKDHWLWNQARHSLVLYPPRASIFSLGSGKNNTTDQIGLSGLMSNLTISNHGGSGHNMPHIGDPSFRT